MNRIRKALFFSGLDKEQYKKLSPNIHLKNTKHIKIYSIVLMCHFTAITILTIIMRSGKIDVTDKLCLLTALTMGILYLISRFVYKRKPTQLWIHTLLNYVFMSVVYAEAIALSCLFPDFVGADKTFYIELVVLPMICMDRSIRMIVFQCLVTFAFIFTGFIYKTPELANYELRNFAFFLLISILIIIFVSSIRIKELLHGQKIQYLSDHDVLTGAKNRNCFESDCPFFESIKDKTLFFVYADVNELHELNNKEGHKAGDIMIQTVAAGLQKIFSDEYTYRVGGDEFIAFSCNHDRAYVENSIQNLQKELSEKEYYVSFGIGGTDENFSSLGELVTKAESRMFEEKKIYYQNKGIEFEKRTRDRSSIL